MSEVLIEQRTIRKHFRVGASRTRLVMLTVMMVVMMNVRMVVSIVGMGVGVGRDEERMWKAKYGK